MPPNIYFCKKYVHKWSLPKHRSLGRLPPPTILFKETIVKFNGFEETIVNFQWFLRRPSPLNVFWRSDHCHQWFFDGFWFFYHRFQWFSMVPDHWSNDAMVSMDRSGLIRVVARHTKKQGRIEIMHCLDKYEYAYKHIHTRIHTQIHIQTHTHTHIYIYKCLDIRVCVQLWDLCPTELCLSKHRPELTTDWISSDNKRNVIDFPSDEVKLAFRFSSHKAIKLVPISASVIKEVILRRRLSDAASTDHRAFNFSWGRDQPSVS